MNDTYDLRIAEAHIEVHKFRGGTILAATILAIFLQTSVPVYFPKFSVLDLPLLLTIYFGLSRRNLRQDCFSAWGLGSCRIV